MNILVVAALKEELAGHFDDVQVLYTGVGKVNATYALTKALVGGHGPLHDDGMGWRSRRPDLVLNFGTAGSVEHWAGTLVYCDYISQRDMDCRAIGFPKGVTPFDKFPSAFTGHPVLGPLRASCFSGDSFEGHPNRGVHDMEAYALARVCAMEHVPFSSVKYVTDSGSGSDWKQNCAKGAARFREIYDQLVTQ